MKKFVAYIIKRNMLVNDKCSKSQKKLKKRIRGWMC
jgi:hypothetical protein